MQYSTLRKLALTLILVLIFLPTGAALPQDNAAIPLAVHDEIPSGINFFLPLVMTLPAEVTDAWIGNQDGIALSTFLPGAPVEYIIVGTNPGSTTVQADLVWNQEGPCGSGQILSKTLDLDPGIWVDVSPSITPDCIGTYTATAHITATNFTTIKSVNFRVNTASVVISDKQGFDRCNIPSIPEMQTWWDSSPYYVANVYLGGVSYDNTTGCSNDNINTNWMQSVADQGWAFLLTWVGPQAPCSGFSYKMSYDKEISYLQGREEAVAALQAAADVGLASSIIIYYDVEGYGNEFNSACRGAVDSFLQGWTDQLHEMGAKSGAYGSPCNSHVSDWADNNPPPDDIWIAHWLGYEYDPFATVWDVTCLSNDLWPDHQRVRQYAGDHTETWGGLPLRIDSNVLDGEVIALANSDTLTTTIVSNLDVLLVEAGSAVYDMGLISPNHGWVLVDDRLMMTRNHGDSWHDLTPTEVENIFDVQFLNAESGLLVYQDPEGLRLLSTSDGGRSWQLVSSLPAGAGMSTAYLDFSDVNTGKLSLKFSLGGIFAQIREFATQDGGRTWLDSATQSMASKEVGSPNETVDNADLSDGAIAVDWVDENTAWVIKQQGACQGIKIPIWSQNPVGEQPWQCSLNDQVWMTEDGGQTWLEITLP